MTRRSLRACLAAGTLLGTLILCPHADAKPPDLPAKPADTVAPAAPDEKPTWESLGGVQSPWDIDEGVWFSVGVAVELGLLLECCPLAFVLFALEPSVSAAPTPTVDTVGMVMKAAPARCARGGSACGAMADCAKRSLSPIRPTARQRLTSCLLFGVNPLLAVAPTEKLLDCPSDHPAPPAPAAQTYNFICGLPTTCEVVQCPADRKDRLQAGRRLLAIGEQLGHLGYLCEALDCFDIVDMLCPGQYDSEVFDAVARVFAHQTEESAKEGAETRQSKLPTGCDTSSPSACPKCEAMHARYCQRRAKAGAAEVQEDAERAAVDEQVTGLMKACHLAVEDGRYDRAAELAHEAYALDPERVLADPLIYKMQLLPRQPKVKVRRAPAYGPGASARPVPFLQPALPPIDLNVSTALEEEYRPSEEQEERTAPPSPQSYPLCREPARSGEGGGPYGLVDTILDAAPLGGKMALGLDEAGILFACDVPVGRSIYHVRYVGGVPAFFVTPNGAATDGPSDEQPHD